ncbi:hypothetical protein [Dyadobacter luticola]|uniref:Uncharacterized protein n=1 Tax=Dyadobacter luticola TaxID=1979387 RepID=A0A5R9L3T6_9BACT|nr:hypothetical protein [Dyadobacter luticola]TLV03071.1 hypothetical protein FEN17_05520 [Dyadobacter luticola]
MKNKHLFLSFLLIFTVGSFATYAQSIVDPGISVYNYKHPNKAAQAKASGKEMHKVRVESYNTLEQYGKHNRMRNYSTTPKYAPRPARLVVAREYKVQGVEINPLNSPRNYKTPTINIRKDTTGLADSYDKSEGTPYPNRD